MSVVGRNFGDGTLVVMAFVGRKFVVFALAQVDKGLEADSIEHDGVKRCLFCNVLSNVSVCGACVEQDCYQTLDMSPAMDKHADVTVEDVKPQLPKVDQRPMITYRLAQQFWNHFPLIKINGGKESQMVISSVVSGSEHGVLGLLVTSGSGVLVADDKIDPRGCMPSSALQFLFPVKIPLIMPLIKVGLLKVFSLKCLEAMNLLLLMTVIKHAYFSPFWKRLTSSGICQAEMFYSKRRVYEACEVSQSITYNQKRVVQRDMLPASAQNNHLPRNVRRYNTINQSWETQSVQFEGQPYTRRVEYHLCCGGGVIFMEQSSDPPAAFQEQLKNKHFMENIRAYNQLFAMTSFGAKIDESVNKGRGHYVFKLYIYDTNNEVSNRMRHFGGANDGSLDLQIVDRLIHILDEHNEFLVVSNHKRQIQRCFCARFQNTAVQHGGVRGYKLPTSQGLSGIVFENGHRSRTDYDVIIKTRGGPLQRINKLHQSYISLQFSLLFVYRQPSYYPKLKLKLMDGSGQRKKYVVNMYCALEQDRMDYAHTHQNDIRSDHLSGLYDAIGRGDLFETASGSKIILPTSFTGGPRYMYSHYLNALAIFRS
ncbi:DNA helicase [Tanacetum coccineum]